MASVKQVILFSPPQHNLDIIYYFKTKKKKERKKTKEKSRWKWWWGWWGTAPKLYNTFKENYYMWFKITLNSLVNGKPNKNVLQ